MDVSLTDHIVLPKMHRTCPEPISSRFYTSEVFAWYLLGLQSRLPISKEMRVYEPIFYNRCISPRSTGYVMLGNTVGNRKFLWYCVVLFSLCVIAFGVLGIHINRNLSMTYWPGDSIVDSVKGGSDYRRVCSTRLKTVLDYHSDLGPN